MAGFSDTHITGMIEMQILLCVQDGNVSKICLYYLNSVSW